MNTHRLPSKITEQRASYRPSFSFAAALLVLGSSSQCNSSPILMWASCFKARPVQVIPIQLALSVLTALLQPALYLYMVTQLAVNCINLWPDQGPELVSPTIFCHLRIWWHSAAGVTGGNWCTAATATGSSSKSLLKSATSAAQPS